MALRTALVVVLVMVTAAPAIAAPLESVTWPVTSPRVCPNRLALAPRQSVASLNNRVLIEFPLQISETNPFYTSRRREKVRRQFHPHCHSAVQGSVITPYLATNVPYSVLESIKMMMASIKSHSNSRQTGYGAISLPGNHLLWNKTVVRNVKEVLALFLTSGKTLSWCGVWSYTVCEEAQS